MTNSSGNIVNKYAYDEFGKVLSQEEAIPNPFKYVGQFGVMDEENGLFYMRARYYDPEVGRFINKDPIGFLGGLNIYAYVENNPVNHIDPEGLEVLLLGRHPFVFRVGRPAPNQRYIPPRHGYSRPAPQICKPVSEPAPNPVPIGRWAQFWKDLADLIDELGLGSGVGPITPYDLNPNYPYEI